MPEIDISYIVVCYNSETHILKCINSILNQTHTNHEIIVVDNNSTDNTKSIINNLSVKNKNIRLILNETNVGYGSAISIAAKNCNGEFLAILNADAFLNTQWAIKMLKAFRDDKNIMSASGAIYFPNGELQSTGGMMDKYGAIIQRGSKLYNSRHIKEDSFFYNDGSSFMIRRQILEEVTFDPNLFLYYEEVDLCWKIRKLGYKIEYVKDAISYHDSGHSFLDMTSFKFYHLAKNRIYVCKKNYSQKNVRKRLPIALLLIFINAIYYDITKNPKGYIKNFFRAFYWNLVNTPSNEEQKSLQLRSKVPDEELGRYLIKKSVEFSIM